ncbi:MAG: lipopolysaccharide biosynthesis protein [Muribaculaceae bacterium]|nr:lipopolysaccharide biosynthesis protein [Muribaculaceae bacterium]
MSDSIGDKATSGVIWTSVDRFLTMGLQFVVNLVLARLLLPSDFGTIGMLAIFIAVSNTLIDGGFASALIQKKEPTNTDYSTIFFWNVGFAVVIYTVLFLMAPWVASFFRLPELRDVLRAIGLFVILSAIYSVQMTRLRKQLQFKKLAIVNIVSYCLAGVTGITMAYRGFGAWSLVAQQLTGAALIVLILFALTRWVPSLEFSKSSMKELFGFGAYILAANLLQEICKNFQGIIIGRRFSAAQMGYYTQAQKMDTVTSYSIPQIIVTVMYPVYSSIQDECERFNKIVAMNVRVIAYIVFPMLSLLILLAEPLVTGLYGAQWDVSVPYYQILCVGGLFVCLQNVNFFAVAAKGQSKALFRWSVYKWSFLLVAILGGSMFGMTGLMWGMVMSNFNIYMVNACLLQCYSGYKVADQLRSLVPMTMSCVIALALSRVVQVAFEWHYGICAVVFGITYLLLSVRMQAAGETLTLLKRLIKNKRNIQ